MDGDFMAGTADQPYLQTEADNRRRYAVCGTRLYSIATLAGQFPDMGSHQPDEMGGIWAPPIKLLDGYWLAVRTGKTLAHWLTSPTTWRMDPQGVTLSYDVPDLGLTVERREWVVPDQPVLVVEVLLHRHPAAAWKQSLSLTCGFLARSDLHGAWLAERLGWIDSDDVAAYDEALAAVTLRDSLNGWEVCVGATQTPVAWQVGKDVWGPERTSGRGTGAALWYRCRVLPDQPARLRFLIAGDASEQLRASALFTQLARVPERSQAVLEQAHQRASERFQQPFAECILHSPDPVLDEVFAWAKASSSMLTLEVPAVGRGVMAGLPEFPWWFGCDLAYGVLPMLPAGQGDVAAESLRLLAKMSQGSGKVPHEVVSHGLLFHAGNLIEIPLFARALYHVYRWTGDRRLLEDLFPFCLQGIEQQALGACLEPGELVPGGASIVETPEMASGLQALDVAASLIEALELLAELAAELGRDELAASLRGRAISTRQQVSADWWLADTHLFGDVRASRAELQALLERFEARPDPDPSLRASIELLRRALAQPPDLATDPEARRPWLFQHMVQALALDAGLPDPEQAAAMSQQLESPAWMADFGIVLNAASGRQVMTLPTGALAAGEARYGRVDAALAIMQRMARAVGAAMPGMLSEYAPDGGCFLQLWSNYGIIWPVIHYFFGLRPDVAARRLVCAPQLPAAWPTARLSDLPLGDARAQVALTALPDGLSIQLDMSDPHWTVTLGAALPMALPVSSATLNGQPVVLAPATLGEHEERACWLAPAMRGTSHYELRISWSKETQSHASQREGLDHITGVSPATR